MSKRTESLDLLGKLIVEKSFDSSISFAVGLRKSKTIPPILSNYHDLVLKLSEEDFSILIDLFKEILWMQLFGVLNIFDTHKQFQLLHTENGVTINLVDDYGMLKSEPVGEDGWIERFSKYSKRNSKSEE